MKSNAGFTLLEVLVTLTIISIVTYLTASAFPVFREEQALQHASQQIVAAVRAAQVAALDEQRNPECLSHVGESPLDAKRCSDIGILLQANELVTFADTRDNNRFDGQDFRLASGALAQPVQVSHPVSLIVEATPPNIVLYVDGAPLAANEHTDVMLRAISLRSHRRTRALSISAYGVVEP